jgi:protein gp37
MKNAVVPIDQLKRAIESAKTVEELQDLKVKVAASVKYAEGLTRKVVGEKSELERRLEETRSLLARISRRLGELLAETVTRRPKGDISQPVTCLPEGVSAMESSRVQAIAAIPEEVFEAEIEAGKTSQAHLVALGKQYRPDNKVVPDSFTAARWGKLSNDKRSEMLQIESKSVFNVTDKDQGGIEWAKWSWNPITGCKHPCPYCYARDIANRFYPQKFTPSFLPSRLRAPKNTTVPKRSEQDVAFQNVFTGSMSDMFGRWVPRDWIDAVLMTVAENPQWNFLFLTKFPKRYVEFEFPRNAWIGTTVDCQARVKAAEQAFDKVDATVKWLSVEPMIEPLRFSRLDLFQWLVIGGASPSTKTPAWHVPIEWWLPLHNEAKELGLDVFHKDNLFCCERGYPGFDWEPPSLPGSFRYLKGKSRDEIVLGEV